MLPEFNASSRCSTSARLRSIAPYGGRKETAVYATDLNSGMVIRCKVYVDAISKIKIFHNSVKLDLDGLATLRVRAFDTEGMLLVCFLWKRFSCFRVFGRVASCFSILCRKFSRFFGIQISVVLAKFLSSFASIE